MSLFSDVSFPVSVGDGRPVKQYDRVWIVDEAKLRLIGPTAVSCIKENPVGRLLLVTIDRDICSPLDAYTSHTAAARALREHVQSLLRTQEQTRQTLLDALQRLDLPGEDLLTPLTPGILTEVDTPS